MTESTGVAIKVQKAMKERKERVMTRSRARHVSEPLSGHTELTSAKGPAPSSGIKRAAPNEHGEPSDLSSKDARKSKSKVSCHKRAKSISPLDREGEEIASGDERVEPEPGPEHALHQVEMQSPARTGKERASPNSSISSPNSVMKTRFGEDSLRLYEACLLPVDQIALAPTAHCTLEEIAAHDLMRAAAVTHQLTLQCAKWRKAAEEKERVVPEVRARHDAFERQLTELRDWSEEAERALLKAKLEIEILEQRGRDSFNAGRAAGRLEMAASDENRAAIRRAALSGIKEYLRSPTFEMLWAAKAAEHEAIGFMRCRSQALELGGFKEGFNVRVLDSAKGGNLDPPTAEVDDDVEFGDLEDRKYMINK